MAWFTVAACASQAYYAPPHPGTDGGPVVAPQQGEIPPQTFTPEPHQPRQHPRAVAASMRALPPMAMSNRCVAAGAVPEGRPPSPAAIAKKTRKPKRGSSFVPYGEAEETADGTKVARKDAPSKPTRTPSPATPSADDVASGAAGEAPRASGGDAGRGMEDAVDVAPGASPEPEPEIASNSKNRREKRKAKRDARRSKPLAQASAEPAPATQPPLPEDEMVATEPVAPQWPPAGQGWGEAIYLSNDDTMSMSSPQRVRYAIENGLPLPLEHIRKHELLNAATFEMAPVDRGHDFSVDAQLAPSNREDGLYTLALGIAGRPVGRDGRRNAVVTLVVDRSGSMREEGRMDYLKRGLLRMVRELKPGDIVNLVTFDHRVCVPLENFVVGRDDASVLTKTFLKLRPSGSTNLHAGLTQGYNLADAAYQPKYTNRVIVITDALANRGVTDAKTMAMAADWFDSRRIRLSGIGVGRTFDDALLDRLTEKGRGAYVFLGSETHVDHVFGRGFTSLVETTANDVHYRLHLPQTMRMQQFHGEEASFHKADVQAVHFFADTSQLLLADVEAWQGQVRPQDGIMLEIEYQHPETGQTLEEQYAIGVSQMLERDNNVRKAEVLMHFAENLQLLIARHGQGNAQGRESFTGGIPQDPEAARHCGHTRRELAHLARGQSDVEVRDVQVLWTRFCTRFGAAPNERPPRKP